MGCIPWRKLKRRFNQPVGEELVIAVENSDEAFERRHVLQLAVVQSALLGPEPRGREQAGRSPSEAADEDTGSQQRSTRETPHDADGPRRFDCAQGVSFDVNPSPGRSMSD
jgi:hypothetical protein